MDGKSVHDLHYMQIYSMFSFSLGDDVRLYKQISSELRMRPRANYTAIYKHMGILSAHA